MHIGIVLLFLELDKHGLDKRLRPIQKEAAQ